MKLRIDAILKTKTPLHIAAPGGARMDPSNGNIVYTGGIPCTTIQKLPIQDGDVIYNYPAIAANNIAGRLRRHAAKIVLDVLKNKGQKVSLHAYSVLQCGAATGNPDAADITYEEWKKATAHPYIGLFGGGNKMLRRKARVHNALPIIQPVLNLIGDLAHPAAETHALPLKSYLTKAWSFRRNDDLRELVNISVAADVVDHFEEEFEKRQISIVTEQLNKKAGESSELKSSTKTFSAIEFVIPGIPFGLLFELDDVTPAQAGLFLLTLESFQKTEHLGGYVRNGFGAFSLNDVRLTNLESGEECNIFDGGALVRPSVSNLLDSWFHEAEKLSAKEIEEIVSVTVKEKKKKEKTEKEPAHSPA